MLEVKRDGVKAVVREHNALRGAGRSACERDSREIVVTICGGLGLNTLAGRCKLRPGKHLVARFDPGSGHLELLEKTDRRGQRCVSRDDDYLLNTRLKEDILERLVIQVDDDKHLCTGLFYKAHCTGCACSRVNDKGSCADLIKTVERIDHLGYRDGRGGDDIALFDAGSGECSGCSVGFVEKLAVADLFAEIVERGVVVPALAALAQMAVNGVLRHGRFPRLFRKELKPRLFNRWC